MRNKRRKWQLRTVIFSTIIVMEVIAAGCNGIWNKGEKKEELREEIIALLPEEEAMDELQIIEREKTRTAILYQVYCRRSSGDGKTAFEKRYLVTCFRKNGEWIYDAKRGVRLMEERTLEIR